MNEQKAKEAKALKEVETPLANKRKLKNLKQNKDADVAVSPLRDTQGRSRDKVAKDVGLRSGREVDRAINAINKIDILKDDGRR